MHDTLLEMHMTSLALPPRLMVSYIRRQNNVVRIGVRPVFLFIVVKFRQVLFNMAAVKFLVL